MADILRFLPRKKPQMLYTTNADLMMMTGRCGRYDDGALDGSVKGPCLQSLCGITIVRDFCRDMLPRACAKI